VTYNLAGWEGEQPDSDEAAAATFRDLCDRYLETAVEREPTARIRSYVEALLARWPDIDDTAGESSPWASAPLINEAIGPVMYFPTVYSQAEEASTYAATIAWAHGLICFDPQQDQLMAPALDAATVDQLICDGKNIQAIAAIRERTGYALREAVNILDQRSRVIATATPAGSDEPAYVFTTPSGRKVDNPSPETLHRALTQLGAEQWSAILERRDGWYIQVGVGNHAGTRPGCYALERHDGSPGAHYRTVLTDLREVVAAFTAFATDDPNWSRRFTWQPYQLLESGQDQTGDPRASSRCCQGSRTGPAPADAGRREEAGISAACSAVSASVFPYC
jgi:hypothetical protein